MQITDRNQAIKAIKEDPYNYQELSDDLKNDKDLLMLAMEENKTSLSFASDESSIPRVSLNSFLKEIVSPTSLSWTLIINKFSYERFTNCR